MALETATYINGLVPANPLGSDQIAFADDHIRLIKSTIKATFPAITGPVTLNQNQINQSMPIGGVIMWSQATVPAGWALCNGQTVAKSDGSGNITTPDLRDRFIVGAGGSYANGTAGGNAFVALSVSQMPAHNHSGVTSTTGDHQHGGQTNLIGNHHHTLPNLGSVQAGSDNGGANIPVNTGYSSGRYQNPTDDAGDHSHMIITDVKGSHYHSLAVDNAGGSQPFDNRPPFYALSYIMKV
jgi:microcystin-dependent protein